MLVEHGIPKQIKRRYGKGSPVPSVNEPVTVVLSDESIGKLAAAIALEITKLSNLTSISQRPQEKIYTTQSNTKPGFVEMDRPYGENEVTADVHVLMSESTTEIKDLDNKLDLISLLTKKK